jgi:ribosomal protein S18 acetylase RimI-like enzyme
MTDPVYRNAIPADAATVADLARRSFDETFGHLYAPEDLALFLGRLTEEAYAAELADPVYAIRLVEVDGEAVGYAKVGPPSLPFTPPADAIELRQFYVLAPYQGAGVAPTMMDWVLAEAQARGMSALYLSVFTDNHRARRFYARYGFEEVGPYIFKVGNHEDEDVVMRRDL